MIKGHFVFGPSGLQSVGLFISPTFSWEIIGANEQQKTLLSHWLSEYTAGTAGGYPGILSLETMTPFQQTVLKELKNLPFGEVISYRSLGKRAGCPKGARAIGSACGANPFPLLIPCHRIIRSDKSIGGFALDLEIKKRLLLHEGRNH